MTLRCPKCGAFISEKNRLSGATAILVRCQKCWALLTIPFERRSKVWRPPNWEDIKWTTIPYNAPAISGDELGKVFEAGATSMLKAISKLTNQEVIDFWRIIKEV